jgi:hypothetical protein
LIASLHEDSKLSNKERGEDASPDG